MLLSTASSEQEWQVIKLSVKTDAFFKLRVNRLCNKAYGDSVTSYAFLYKPVRKN